MNASRAIAIAFILVHTAADAAPDAAAAKSKLDAASEKLAKAVKQIEKDPPATPDLEAAWAAVSTLKDAIDSGADFESKDLDYAKAALAARKQLRTQRDYVEERRAKVHLHNHRRTIDAAMATLTERAGKTDKKDAAQKDFEDARAAAAAVKKAVDPAREFAKQDQGFAKYLSDTDAAVAKHEKAIEDRWTLRAVDTHRARVEEGRHALADALAAAAKNSGDAQFSAADGAVTSLSKMLDEGKNFEPRDRAYASVADKARVDVSEAKKKLEQLLSTSALDRLKSEVEPANKDLAAALKAIRARKPTDEQLAEAKTAAIVVRSLVDKFQPQAARSPPFGQYLNQVKATLVEVESLLLSRGIEGAKADLLKSLRGIERRDPTDEQFAEVNTAVTVLEKTLEPIKKVDPSVAAVVADARQWVHDAKATATKRRYEVDLMHMKAKVQETKKNTEAVVREIQAPEAGQEQLQAAENAIKLLTSALEEGAPFVKKDGDYAAFDKDTKQRIADLNDRIAKRRLALAVKDARAKLTETMADGKAKVDAAGKPEATDADLEAATKAVTALTQTIEGNAALEKQDGSYVAHADRARNELMREAEALEIAKQSTTARKQTGTLLGAGEVAARAAAEAKDLRQQKKHYEAALSQFKSCEQNGKMLLRENAAFGKVIAIVEGRQLPIKDVYSQCQERAKAMEQPLRQASSMVAFEDGPKKAYEAAKGLVARSKRDEAIPQFDECIVSAGRVRYDYPELKENKFPVAGTSMTLTEMIKDCSAQRAALVKK